MDKRYNINIRKVPTGFFLNINKKLVLFAMDFTHIPNQEINYTDHFPGTKVVFFSKAKRLLFNFGNKFLNILF